MEAGRDEEGAVGVDYDPLTPHEILIHRDRILAEIARIRREPKGPEVNFEQTEALFNKAARVSNKANVLLKRLAEVADKYFIPVHPEAQKVRGAVKRTSADSPDGLQISFDLFRDALESLQRQKKNMEPHVILSQSIEPDSVFSKKMRKIRAATRLSSGGLDADDDYLEMLISQFCILYIAHYLMKPFNNLLDLLPLSQTLKAKEDDEVVYAEIVIQLLIGLAIQLIIFELNEQLMEKALEDTAMIPKGMTAKEIIQRAKAAPKNKAQEMALAYKSLSDYEIILGYAFEFLAKTIEPGYEMWIAYADTVRVRGTAQSMWAYAPHYSPPHALRTLNLPRLASASHTLQDNRDRELQRFLYNTLTPMSSMAYSTRSQALDKSDDVLNMIAQTLSADYAVGLACCLGAKMGKVNPKVLKYLKSVMEGIMRANAFDIRQSINALHDSLVHPNFEEIIANEAMHQVDKVFDKITKNLLGLFGKDWEPLVCCPLLGEMIQATLEMLVRLEAEMKGACSIFSGKVMEAIGVGGNDVTNRYEITHENRTLRKIIIILDSIIRAAESLDLCSQNWAGTPVPEPLRYALALPTVRIEPDESKNYFSNALPRELSTGKLLPSVGEEITSLYGNALQTSIDRIQGAHPCGAPASTDNIDRAVAAMAPAQPPVDNASLPPNVE